MTPIEFRLLRQFMSKTNQTFTREVLIETVYGYNCYI
ncbi:MAG TPA: winged helix family transcriptional regulator [bacterium]|nr:winged helix family transcriptional regulator [bacterium]